MVQGNPCFHSPKLSQLNTLTSESHDNADADLGPESEELDEEPSAMQFSNAVSTGFLTLHYLAIMWLQIRSKGVVEQPKKLKARKVTDPPPIHGNHEIPREQEQNRTTVM